LKKTSLIIAIVLLGALLTGCGAAEDKLAQYKADMTSFTDHVNELVTSIDNIDLDSDTRTQELLGYLDEMDTAFQEMGNLEVPEQFANVEELADDASSNLSKSVELYHQAFDEGGTYDPALIDAALEYYSRAFKRLDYIGTILQGQLPEDETITIIHESEDEESPEDGGESAPDAGAEPSQPEEETEDMEDAVG